MSVADTTISGSRLMVTWYGITILNRSPCTPHSHTQAARGRRVQRVANHSSTRPSNITICGSRKAAAAVISGPLWPLLHFLLDNVDDVSRCKQRRHPGCKRAKHRNWVYLSLMAVLLPEKTGFNPHSNRVQQHRDGRGASATSIGQVEVGTTGRKHK